MRHDTLSSLFSDVASFVQDGAVTSYLLEPPFDPPQSFPELPFVKGTQPENRVYSLVRDLLLELRLDEAGIGTSQWNPFSSLIRPGDCVVIKPNLVTHRHYLGPEHLYSTIIHGSILRPLIDYVFRALGDSGSIVIADNPLERADFSEILRFTGIGDMVAHLNRVGYHSLSVLDMRPRVLCELPNGSYEHSTQAGDPKGYATVDLQSDSMFAEFDSVSGIHYYTLADPAVDHIDPHFVGESTTDGFHHPGRHAYVVSKTVLSADVVINVSKMKCHCKSGVSLALKNMIGVVHDKFCMPHHRPGSPPDGDSFPSPPARHYVAARKAYVKLRKWVRIHKMPGFRFMRNRMQQHKILVGQHIEHGNWRGNDTIWRTILDLNRIVLYANCDGVMQETPQRRMFCLVDGVVSQQGDAPINGEATPTGTLVAGMNPVVTDSLALSIMGIDREMIRASSRARDARRWPLVNDAVSSFLEAPNWDTPNLGFRLSKGWR